MRAHDLCSFSIARGEPSARNGEWCVAVSTSIAPADHILLAAASTGKPCTALATSALKGTKCEGCILNLLSSADRMFSQHS